MSSLSETASLYFHHFLQLLLILWDVWVNSENLTDIVFPVQGILGTAVHVCFELLGEKKC